MKVVITSAAEGDLRSIANYIRADNPARAVTFVRELREKCLGLAVMPRRFPLIPRYESSGVRRRGHGRYLIFYRVRGELIEVLHVLHGAQDYERLLIADE